MIYVDADDFCERNSGNGVLEGIHDRNPAFKITLFAPPGLCPPSFLEKWLAVPWVRLIAHGWDHDTNRECLHWTYQQMNTALDRAEKLGFGKGWKSPGWQSSRSVFYALRDRGWWLAGQRYDDYRHPIDLTVYYPGKHHYHIGGGSENDIANHADTLAELEGDYGFIGQ